MRLVYGGGGLGLDGGTRSRVCIIVINPIILNTGYLQTSVTHKHRAFNVVVKESAIWKTEILAETENWLDCTKLSCLFFFRNGNISQSKYVRSN